MVFIFLFKTVPRWDCNKYEKEIQAPDGIKLFPRGIDKNEHMGLSEPEPSLSSHARIKTVAYDTILVNAHFLGYCTTLPLYHAWRIRCM